VARFYPKVQPASAPASERRVFEALKKLEDDWVVVHGLRFVTSARGKSAPRNGEADFVLVHPRHGILVLEVKGGRYEVKDGSWFTFPGGKRTSMARSPFGQATQNRYDLAQHIASRTGMRGLPFGHAVIFTDGAPRGQLGPEAPQGITVDGTQIADIARAIGRICEHWFAPGAPGLTKQQFSQVMSVLAPTAEVVADQKYYVDVTLVDVRQFTERQIRFTDEQIAVIEATTPGAFISVLGAAGTGKTIIAARRAGHLAREGLKVLFVADQKYLHGTLRDQPLLRHPNVVLGTPEEALQQLEPEGIPASDKGPLWARFLEVAEAGVLVDTVIVDEAQSYDEDLLDAMRSLCPESCHLYADPYQRDSSGRWRPPGTPHTFWLTQNCRNSLPIAKLVARIGGCLTPAEGASGHQPRFIEAGRDRETFNARFASVIIEKLRTLATKDIAVLACAQQTTELRRILATHHVRIARRPGDEGVTLVPAREFRGCEAPVVFLVAGPGHACPADAATTNHYVATSRAVADLTIIGNPSDWDMYRFLMETS
jgi:hypothetical protein